MRDAKLPMQYRDSCAHLLIPLNRCRFETFYMPWKCEVRIAPDRAEEKSWKQQETPPRGPDRLTLRAAGRETQLRKVPIRRVQEAGRQDERAQGGQGRRAEQLRKEPWFGPGPGDGLAVYICREECVLGTIDGNAPHHTFTRCSCSRSIAVFPLARSDHESIVHLAQAPSLASREGATIHPNTRRVENYRPPMLQHFRTASSAVQFQEEVEINLSRLVYQINQLPGARDQTSRTFNKPTELYPRRKLGSALDTACLARRQIAHTLLVQALARPPR